MNKNLEILRNVINALIQIREAEKLFKDENNLLRRAKTDLKLLAHHLIENL